MTETDTVSQQSADAAAEPAGKPARTDMSVTEVRRWLRNWVAKATGQSPDSIDEATPMVELGLSSRDAVAMAADIEDRTGVTVSIAAAFEHPTIERLATWSSGEVTLDGSDWTAASLGERQSAVALFTTLPESTSAWVVVWPREKRSEPRARDSSAPMASSTWLGSATPAVQADPVEQATFLASSSSRRASPSQPGKEKCTLPGSRSGPGQVRCRPMSAWWDGGLVVVRARERRAHGEGDQQICKEDIGMPGGRW